MFSAKIRTLDRKGTDSVKWDFVRDPSNCFSLKLSSAIDSKKEILPMWVADMDFECPEKVIEALSKRIQHGIYGYTYAASSYYESVSNWMWKRHGWKINPNDITITPGVVPALKIAVKTFAGHGEKVIIQPPVYHPFFSAAECNRASLELNCLINHGETYAMDFEGFEHIVRNRDVKLFILCNPHNPVGRVWSREELLKIGEICLKYGVIVVSDEIHSDLIYSWSRHTPFASISKEFADISITCTAASKTFNLAGLYTSNIIIPNPKLKELFDNVLSSSGANEVNIFGLIATEAAYRHGESWLKELMSYIESNYLYIEAFVKNNMPKIKLFKPEGTYLLWIDMSALELSRSEINNLLLDKAGLGLDEGLAFGNEGVGFLRLNMATSMKNIKEAMDRLLKAFGS
ncbi:MAG TPA: cystathionine beta-lyase [Lentisphaeria bacterium]|nr:MAG: hypothetical protein A2X47_13675 [Lentisphaerae bacterium GWF2_38_69]HBM17406.1 cystathionine beta-lyase [Lentisphaeria bacterium]